MRLGGTPGAIGAGCKTGTLAKGFQGRGGTGTPTVGRIEPEGAKAIEDKAGAANQVSGTGYMDQGVQGTNRGEAQLHGVRVFCVLRVCYV